MYTLLVVAPCSPRIKGKSRALFAGDILKLEDEVAQQLINGPLGRKFKVQHVLEDVEVPVEEPVINTPAAEFAESKLLNDLVVDTVVQQEEDAVYKEIPLEDGAHWTKVRNYVLELEEKYPVDLDQIAAIKERFSEYKSVVKECDRILSAFSKE